MDKVKTSSDTKFEILSSESCRNRHSQIGGRYLQVSCSAVTATGGRAVTQAVSRRGGPGSIPEQPVWDLCLTYWN